MQGCGPFRWWRSPHAASCKQRNTFFRIILEGTARIIEGLMTGMGFIGGGAILKTRELRSRYGTRRQPLGDWCDGGRRGARRL